MLKTNISGNHSFVEKTTKRVVFSYLFGSHFSDSSNQVCNAIEIENIQNVANVRIAFSINIGSEACLILQLYILSPPPPKKKQPDKTKYVHLPYMYVHARSNLG